MKGLLSGLSALLILMSCGCAPSPQQENPEELYKNLIALNPPDDQSSREESQVYIDSVSVTDNEGRRSLVIHGSFPDGCTSLESADHSVRRDTLVLSLSAWRDPDLVCTQVLTQFTFIYDKFGNRELSNFTTVVVNSTTFNIQING